MSEPSEFNRGHAAGEIAQRLREHDQHFDRINGSLGEVATELRNLSLAVQRLDDRMAANLATVATTAGAVEKERDATALAVEKQRITTRDASERRWSPTMRLLAIIGGIAAAAGVALAIYSAAHP